MAMKLAMEVSRGVICNSLFLNTCFEEVDLNKSQINLFKTCIGEEWAAGDPTWCLHRNAHFENQFFDYLIILNRTGYRKDRNNINASWSLPNVFITLGLKLLHTSALLGQI